MAIRLAALACVMGGLCAAAADDKPLAPADARNHVGKQVTVEMVVKASKKSTKRKMVFLDSHEQHTDPDNLGVTLTEAVETELVRKHSAQDVAQFFRDKKIRVTGTVVRRDDHTYIDLETAERISLVEKNP